MKNINIKLCPFCGGVVRVYEHPVVRIISFVCEDCDMNTNIYADSIQEAVEHWNERK